MTSLDISQLPPPFPNLLLGVLGRVNPLQCLLIFREMAMVHVTLGGFRSSLEALLSNDSVKCNAIYATNKGAKISAPSIINANLIKEKLNNADNLKSLKVNIVTKESPKFIIKFTDHKKELPFKDQLIFKNPVFAELNFNIIFKIDTKEQVHWVIEVPPTAYRRVDKLGSVYLGLTKHKITEFLSIKHCKKCCQYGHTTKKCAYVEARCIKCGEVSHTGPCTLRFFNCHSKNKNNDGFNEIFKTNHKIATINCPEYRKHERIARSRVDHGD
ncbi:hypothetical protein JTE90_004021 [Oedothorax gibbosus]|uniref:Uncharacterized protein n=1 Tax=Oedothorax gibbosus TaxID=931172 RepID=A0AAV6U573_9ARAC|nr:hypothetical protein JTE90_004021 [Oedothorax gibbosus]